jgi:hypothetical protein
MDLFWLTVSEVSVPHFREGKVDQSSSQPGSRKRKRERERERERERMGFLLLPLLFRLGMDYNP